MEFQVCLGGREGMKLCLEQNQRYKALLLSWLELPQEPEHKEVLSSGGCFRKVTTPGTQKPPQRGQISSVDQWGVGGRWT